MLKEGLVRKYQNDLTVGSKAAKVNIMSCGTLAEAFVNVQENVGRELRESVVAGIINQGDVPTYERKIKNINTFVMPTLIAPNFAVTEPMESRFKDVVYTDYQYGTAKGEVEKGTSFENAFKLNYGVNKDGAYTGSLVPEQVKVTSAQASAHKLVLSEVCAWIENVTALKIGETAYEIITSGVPTKDVSVLFANGELTFASGDGTADTKFVENAVVKLLGTYDNITVPQKKLPAIAIKEKHITLDGARICRRLGLSVNDIAAFLYEREIGASMIKNLTEVAKAMVSFDIDNQIVSEIVEKGTAPATPIVFDKKLSYSQTKSLHYADFADTILTASNLIYTRTGKFRANKMIIGINVLNVVAYLPGYKASDEVQVNGPFKAGTYNGIEIFVSPVLDADTWVVLHNGGNLKGANSIFAPFMPVAPGQVIETMGLEYPDGTTEKGFFALYDFQVVNPDFIVKGTITDTTNA